MCIYIRPYDCCSSIVELLVAKGYMELEETLMQWKQYSHLMEVLEVSQLSYVRCLATTDMSDNCL
jgi:hypothetical protein